jgi:hypothetical protein
MFSLSMSLLLLCWSPQAAEPQAQPPPAPTTTPTYDAGPLRAELVAMRELRYKFVDPEQAARYRSELDMRFRIRGERITEVVRYGNLIFSELVDDTGHSLLDPNTYTEAEKTSTRPIPVPAERLKADGLIVDTRNSPSTRGALTLSRVRGSVHLIIAPNTEKVTIADPLQYYGKTIADPRLKQLGIEIQLVPIEELENAPPANRGLVLRYVTNGEHVQKASFYDGHMRLVPTRESPTTTKSGAPCQLYYFDSSPLNDETQLVLEVLPQVDEVQVPVEMDGLKLP